jgi:hypothetical protein
MGIKGGGKEQYGCRQGKRKTRRGAGLYKKAHGVRLLAFVWVSKCAFDVRKLNRKLITYRQSLTMGA